MPEHVTLQVFTKGFQEKRPFTVMTENKDYVNSVVTFLEDNTITETDKKYLQQVAGRGGDLGILEESDFTIEEKIKLAEFRGFDKFYDIKLSKDGKFLKVKIKETSQFSSDPTLGNIKKDFGVRDNVFVQKDKIPYGNEDLIRNAHKSLGEAAGNTDYDTTQLRPNNTINIPIEEVHFNDQARGWWARLVN